MSVIVVCVDIVVLNCAIHIVISKCAKSCLEYNGTHLAAELSVMFVTVNPELDPV